MAQTCAGLSSVIYDVHIDDYAAEYASKLHGTPFTARLLGRSFDEDKWQATFDDFKARVDTPEKLFRWSEALYEAGA